MNKHTRSKEGGTTTPEPAKETDKKKEPAKHKAPVSHKRKQAEEVHEEEKKSSNEEEKVEVNDKAVAEETMQSGTVGVGIPTSMVEKELEAVMQRVQEEQQILDNTPTGLLSKRTKIKRVSLTNNLGQNADYSIETNKKAGMYVSTLKRFTVGNTPFMAELSCLMHGMIIGICINYKQIDIFR